MTSAAFPSVLEAVQTLAESVLTNVRVVRGQDLSDDPSDVVMVGVQGVQETDWNSAGNFRQEWQTFGGNRLEIGTVNGLILASTGNADQTEAFDIAFGYLASIEAAVRADKSLGLTQFGYVAAETRSGDVSESQNDQGATTALAFAIDYQARI